MPSVDAILLIAFGGPERPEDVRPFLDEVLRGRPVPRERYEAVVHHYELIGGRSPLNALTFGQARALAAELERGGRPLPVYVGMRSWTPTIAGTLDAMAGDGVRRALAIVLAPHRTEASWERYRTAVDDGRTRLGAAAPEVVYAAPWFDHPEFVAAVAERTRAALATVPDASAAALVFTAHSIPAAMAASSPYAREIATSSRLVATALGGRPYTIAYQSRSGAPHEPWLEPDVNVHLRALAADGVGDVVVVPIGFVCDHVEVLYDLDVEARATADALGIRLARAGTVNDHPAFIRMLAALVAAEERS